MNDNPPTDWLEFWVRFFCGTIAGMIACFTAGLKAEFAQTDSWMVLAGGGVVFGLVAAWFGDRFWRALLSTMRGL